MRPTSCGPGVRSLSCVGAILGRLPLRLLVLIEGCLDVISEQVTMVVVPVGLSRVHSSDLTGGASKGHAILASQVPGIRHHKLKESVGVDVS